MSSKKTLENGLTVDSLRREHDSKIDKKLDSKFFYFIITGLFAIFSYIAIWLHSDINQLRRSNVAQVKEITIIQSQVKQLSSGTN